MKTLTKNNISIYLFEDDVVLSFTAENITVGQPPKFIIGDCNESNTVLFSNITAPADWSGCKYFYDGNMWSLNPDWIEPEPDVEG